jgi:hypothetical protein
MVAHRINLARRDTAEGLRRPVATVPVCQPPSAGRLASAATKSEPAEPVAAAELVPEHLLDGGEVVILAIKPSLWFIVFASARFLLAMVLVMAIAPWVAPLIPGSETSHFVKVAAALAAGRLGFAVLEWASRLYVLTNRRVMRIRGIFNINLFECALARVQNTYLTLAWYERLTRLGTISFATAGTSSLEASWLHCAHPLEVHEQVRAAIRRARGQGNGL